MNRWIKLDKDLPESIRFRRVVRKLRDTSNALRSVTDALAVTVVLGALQRFWSYADSNIAEDNTMNITQDEINEIVGVDGFAQALPADWLQVIEPDKVQLPDFLEHNGSSEKQRRDSARRQAEYRHRHRSRNVTRDVTPSNARNDARPDQKRLEETRPEKNSQSAQTVDPDLDPRNQAAWLECKAAYPPHTHGEHHWLNAERDACQRVEEGERWSVIKAGCERLYAQQLAKGNIGKEFVPSPAEFFSRRLKRYLEPFPIPITKADQRLAGNLSAADEFMRRTEVLR